MWITDDGLSWDINDIDDTGWIHDLTVFGDKWVAVGGSLDESGDSPRSGNDLGECVLAGVFPL